MNSKLVLWGTNAQDEKILVALELLVEENKVKIYTFPDKIVLDDFYDQMRNHWRVGKEVTFVEGFTEEIRDLTASETLLPDHIKVERTDLIEKKQLEWHVLVLSSKMHSQFKSELDSIRNRVEQLDSFDNSIWESLKSFWAKVQNQIKDGILTRNYANDLRKGTDELFDQLKTLRKKLDEEYRSKAKENFDWFTVKLDEIEKRIEEGLKLSGVFEDLKELQRKFHNTKFTKEFREKVWNRLDGSFKAVKDKRYGKKASNENSATTRMNNRYEGLLKAIKRTEFSRDRDLKDLEFENRRIQRTDGQLEAQIREAKIKMINQRLKFKEDKLKEMYATKTQLDKKMAKQQEKERLDKIRREKEAAAKAKIQEEAKATKENMDDATKEKLAAAAEEINSSKKKKKDLVDKVMDTVEEVRDMIEEKMEDTIISAKAAAVVISEEVSEKMEPFTEKGKEVVDDLTSKAEEKVEEVKEAFSSNNEDSNEEKGFFDKAKDVAEQIKDKVEEKVEEAKEAFSSEDDTSDHDDAKEKGFFDKAKDVAEQIKDKVEEKVEEAKQVVEDKIEEEKEGKGFLSKAMETLGDIKENISETLEEVSEKMEPYAEKGKEIVDDLTNKASDAMEEVKKTAKDVKDDIAEQVDDITKDKEDTPPTDA